MNWTLFRQRIMLLGLLGSLINFMSFLYNTQEWALFGAIVLAFFGGEAVNLATKGQTMSGEFLRKWSESPAKTWVAISLQLLLNLFGLHLQGWV